METFISSTAYTRMPLKPGQTLDRPCGARECPHAAEFILTSPTAQLVQCLDHIEEAVLPWVLQTPGSAGLCVACGSPATSTFSVDVGSYEGSFCPQHALAFLSAALEEDAFFRVSLDASDPDEVALLDEAHYTEDGEAMIPLPLGDQEAADYVYEVLANPTEDLHVDAEDFCQTPALLEAMQAGYLRATGFEISTALAHGMVHEVIELAIRAYEDSSLYGYPPSARLREQYRPHIEEILREVDPQGIVSSGIESSPYAVEAAWLSRHILGYEDEEIERLYHLVATCFQHSPYEEVEPHTHRMLNKVVARLLARVTLPLRHELQLDQGGNRIPPEEDAA